VDVSYHVENGQLQANPHFVIDQLQLGAPVASPDAIKLPLKLAIALLKDRNGVIDIGLPISGNLSDPQFRIAPLVWKAIVGLITKAATAPFAMLGHLFGGSAGEQLNVIAFAAGSARLDTQAQERLAALKHALTERPGLQLDVPAAYSPAQDTPALARAKLYAQLLPASAPPAGDTPAQSAPAPEPVIPQDPAQRLPLLLAAYHRTFGKKAPLPAPRAPAAAATEGRTAAAEAAGEKTVANAASAPGGSAPAPSPAAPPPADAAPTPDKAAGQADPAATADALEGALLQKITVNDSELVRLGQRRARAVQDALLSGGQVDPARVFVINAPPRPASGERVNLELSLK